jgi:hypothetical protein
MKFDYNGAALTSYNFATARRLGFFAGCIIGLMSLYSNAFEVIGHDSVLYIQTASLYNELGFQAAFQQYNWPVYPILIATVQSLTGFTLINSAHLLNLAFVLLMADAFYRLYWQAFPGCKFSWAPVVIFLAYTGINDYRAEIVRDWGFWAFAMLTLLYFLKAYKQGKLSDNLLCRICAIVALLFRIEAIVFMVMLPLLFLIIKKQLLTFFQSSCLFLFAGIILWLYFSFSDNSQLTFWGKLEEFTPFLQAQDWLSVFKQESLDHGQRIFPHHADGHALLFMVTGLMGVLLTKVFTKIGFGYWFIAVMGWFKRRKKVNQQSLLLILFFAFVAFFPVFIFFAKTKILAGRYVIFTVLILLLLVTYFFEQLISYCQTNKKKYCLLGLVGLLVVNFMFGAIHSKSKQIYLKDIGLWADGNIPENASVLANEVRLCFYSNRQANCYKHTVDETKVLTHNILKRYDYLLWKIKGQNQQINSLLALGKLKQIHAIVRNRSDTSAVLYKIVNS